MYTAVHVIYCCFVNVQHVPLRIKKDTTTARIAKTYEEERSYRMYINDIWNWREDTAVIFKVPKKKVSLGMKIMIMEIQKKLEVKASPEELMCKIAIRKCLEDREQLINQLHKQ